RARRARRSRAGAGLVPVGSKPSSPRAEPVGAPQQPDPPGPSAPSIASPVGCRVPANVPRGVSGERLPLNRADLDAGSAAVTYPVRQMLPRPVLVVDDDPDIRETLRFVLEDAGYPVYSAENGEEALAVLASVNPLPGLILLDLMMPVMSGDE